MTLITSFILTTLAWFIFLNALTYASWRHSYQVPYFFFNLLIATTYLVCLSSAISTLPKDPAPSFLITWYFSINYLNVNLFSTLEINPFTPFHSIILPGNMGKMVILMMRIVVVICVDIKEMINHHHPPCRVDIMLTLSLCSRTVCYLSDNYQSASLISTKMPGRLDREGCTSCRFGRTSLASGLHACLLARLLLFGL